MADLGSRRERRRALAVLALAGACSGAPPVGPPASCPPPGPRTVDANDRAAAAPGDAARGQRLFAEACNGCHAAAAWQRAPDAPARTPRLDCPAWLATLTDGYLYGAINRGPGAYGHGILPPLGLQLAPADVSDLVAYLRSLERRER